MRKAYSLEYQFDILTLKHEGCSFKYQFDFDFNSVHMSSMLA
jgi:hypothetical protein